MDPIALLICAAITLGAAWLVAQPLLRGPGASSDAEANTPEDDPTRQLQVEKQILYQSLHELDLDYAADKLSDEDYRALRARQEAQAVDLLKAIDAATTASPSLPKAKPQPK